MSNDPGEQISHERGSGAEQRALPALSAVVGAAALLQGAYYWPQLRLVVALAVLTVLVAGRTLPLAVPVRLGFVALAAGLFASAVANDFPPAAAIPAASLVLGICVFLLASRAIVVDGAAAVLSAIVAIGAVVGALGLAGVAFHLDALAIDADPWRLSSTLTYQNAAAGLLALALAPALVLASRDRLHRVPLVVIAVALLATASRGGILAGAVVVLVCLPARVPLPVGAARLVLATLVGAGGLVPAMIDIPAGPLFAVAGWVLAVLVARVPARSSRTVVAGAVVAAVALVLLLPTTAIRGRLTTSSMDRVRVWTQSIEASRADPVFGTGPGTFTLAGRREGRMVTTRHAHNGLIEALVETGVVGLGALLLALGAFGVVVRRALWSRSPMRAAAAAGCVGFAVHGLVDFVWAVPALAAIAFALLPVADREGPADGSGHPQGHHEPVTDGQDRG